MRCAPSGRLSLNRERRRVRVHRTQQDAQDLQTPHLPPSQRYGAAGSPLPFFEGRGEKSCVGRGADLLARPRRSKRSFQLATNISAAGLWIGALLIAAASAAAGANGLPIYIEDNHAGTFYWLAQNIDLDQSYTLVLFDAHSDASGIFDSDKIRLRASKCCVCAGSPNAARSLAQQRRCPMLQLDRAAHAGAD